MNEKARINVFAGHFGSGKTEIAINYALKLSEEGKKVAIVDIDIVNPYFNVRDVRGFLEEKGIRVISSNPDLANAELMVVTGEVNSVFNDKSYDVIIDVGGDPEGAVVLGQYNRFFREEPYIMNFVVNTKRPLTSDSESTEDYLRNIERVSRLKAGSLIANSNLSYDTCENDVIEGDLEVEKLGQKLGIPHTYTVCKEELLEGLVGKTKGDLFPIKIFMKPPWR